MEDPLNSDKSRQLRVLYNPYKTLLRQNALKCAKRSRLLWVHNGDLNSKFLHESARVHDHNNRISHIANANSSIYANRDDIGLCFMNFYSNLWRSTSLFAFDGILMAFPTDLNTLSDFGQNYFY